MTENYKKAQHYCILYLICSNTNNLFSSLQMIHSRAVHQRRQKLKERTHQVSGLYDPQESILPLTDLYYTYSILLIVTYRPAVAHEVMTDNITLIKRAGIGLVLLADKLLEKKIINERQKKAVTDRFTGRTEDERMDDLLHTLMTSIKVEGKVFGIFLEILKEEDTLVSISLADKLLADYKAKCNNLIVN